MVPVVVGVLLALLINQWQQDRQERQFVERSLQAISAQNKINAEELQYALKRQKTLIDTLRKYLGNDEFNMWQTVQRAGGLYTPDLRSTTWQFLIQNNNHTLVPYEYLSALAEIEKYEGLIDRSNNAFSNLFFETKTLSDPDYKKILLANLYDLQNVEQQLLATFQSLDSLSFD